MKVGPIRPLLLLVPGLAAMAGPAAASPFDEFLPPDAVVATGFSAPPRRAKVALALADGRVLEAAPGRLRVEHQFHENHRLRRIVAQYDSLDPLPLLADWRKAARLPRKAQDPVAARDPLGLLGPSSRVRVFDEHGQELDVASLVSGRARLPDLRGEPQLVLVHQDSRRARYYERGRLEAEWEVAFGQAEGSKEVRGDLKTPRGMYFVVEKRSGEFPGPSGEYFGGHWVKINYPNRFDADRGLALGLIDHRQHQAIARAWERRELTPQKSRLGGGIGFHGWASEWTGTEDGYRLSWGCVVLHQKDIAAFYSRLSPGAMVVIF